MSDMTYPVTEIFDSIQGEGLWAGQQMAFVRLAGCTVGKPYTAAAREALGIESYQERCTDWAGMSFPCDTNYRRRLNVTITDILACEAVRAHEHVSITGGEPMMYNLDPLLTALWSVGKLTHIETSGTFPIPEEFDNEAFNWVISPKQGYLPENLKRAGQVKILVGDAFDEEKFLKEFLDLMSSDTYVFVQPVGDLRGSIQTNVNRCMELCRKYPRLRLSLQLHKILGVR